MAPTPYEFDPTNGVKPDGAPFELGPDKATAGEPPQDVHRLQRAEFKWTGGPRAFERPLEKAFVHVERQGKKGRPVAVHRLDRDTSGLVVFARTPDAARLNGLEG